MPDRLVEIYGLVVRKVEDVDRALKDVLEGDSKAVAGRRPAIERLKKDWSELLGLVAQQKKMLGEIARRTQELSSLSAFLQTLATTASRPVCNRGFRG